MEVKNLPDFKGKLVVLYTSNAPNAIKDGILMEYASFTEYGGRLFLTGRTPAIEDKSLAWVSNLQGGVAWDDVTHYLIFDSRDDYLNRMGTAAVPFWHRIFG